MNHAPHHVQIKIQQVQNDEAKGIWAIHGAVARNFLDNPHKKALG